MLWKEKDRSMDKYQAARAACDQSSLFGVQAWPGVLRRAAGRPCGEILTMMTVVTYIIWNLSVDAFGFALYAAGGSPESTRWTALNAGRRKWFLRRKENLYNLALYPLRFLLGGARSIRGG